MASQPKVARTDNSEAGRLNQWSHTSISVLWLCVIIVLSFLLCFYTYFITTGICYWNLICYSKSIAFLIQIWICREIKFIFKLSIVIVAVILVLKLMLHWNYCGYKAQGQTRVLMLIRSWFSAVPVRVCLILYLLLLVLDLVLVLPLVWAIIRIVTVSVRLSVTLSVAIGITITFTVTISICINSLQLVIGK